MTPYRFRGVGSRGSARRLGMEPLRFSDPSSWADAEDAPASSFNRIAGFSCSFAELIGEALVDSDSHESNDTTEGKS